MTLSNQEKEKYIKRTALFAAELSTGISVDDLVKSKEYHYDNAPKKLYKYCKVNKNSISTIREQYWWISDIEHLDDQFEATIKYVKSPSLLDKGNLEEEITEYVISELSKKQPEIKRLYKTLKNDLTNCFSLEKLKESSFGIIQNDKEKEMMDSIEALFQNETFIKLNEALIKMIIDLDKELGVCSLTETNKSQVMWQMYANNYNGIVIEYDMTSINEETKFSLIPVIYANERKTDPIKLYLDLMMNSAEKTKQQSMRFLFEWMLRVISTKNPEWELQKEWRVIGKPNSRFISAPISAIYLGKNLCKTNRNKVLRIARKNNIAVFEQTENYEKISIEYKQIL